MGLLHRLERRRRVPAPDGRIWTVRRRVLRRAPTWVGWGFGLRPFLTQPRTTTGWGRYWMWIAITIAFLMFGFVSSLVLLGVGAVLLLVVWTFVVPPVVWAVDLLFVVTVAGIDLAQHQFLRTPWTVEATDEVHTARGFDRTVHRWSVRGGTASSTAVADVADRIRRGASVRLPVTAGRPVI